ncbi:MAG TPA: type VI secretion system baseplate subunit TssE [Terriglobia bacterium]|nr:type VI secretion system baseplate subunit TssE [Terriglobia bacterium]
MAKREIDAPVRLSVLDRLLDSDPKSGVEAPLTRAQSLREMKAALRRDLEWLLNTRQPLHVMAENPRELQGTIYDYGLPDITSLSLRSAKDQSRLLRTIESTIAEFEPRLLGVKVSLQPLSESNRSLHFLIEGLLRVDPAPEHVYFDTVLETNTGEYEVKGEGSAR